MWHLCCIVVSDGYIIWQFLASKAVVAEFDSSPTSPWEARTEGGILSLPQSPLCISSVYTQPSCGSRPVWSKGLLPLSLGQSQSVPSAREILHPSVCRSSPASPGGCFADCIMTIWFRSLKSACNYLSFIIFVKLCWANRCYTIFHFLSQTVLWYVWVQGRQDTSCFCFNSSRLEAYLGTTQTKYISQKYLLTAKLSLQSLASWHSGGKLGHPATEWSMTFPFSVKSPFTQHGATHWLIWEHPLLLLYLSHCKLPFPISQKVNACVNIGFL